MTPPAVTSAIALAMMPSWYTGSLKYEMSSTMTLAPAAARARIWFAKSTSPLKAEATRIEAPGARSWTACAMARPSSLPPVLALSSSDWTTTGVVRPHGLPAPGSSPLATSVAAPPRRSYESDSTPILMPVPSTP